MQHPSHSKFAITSVLALLLASGIAGAALSLAPTNPEDRLTALLPRLGADSLEDREKASGALARDREITLPMIERVLAGSDSLSPEQMERLCQKGEELFADQPRAAMGVSFSWGENSPDGVEISGTIPGFDSQRVLQPGDVIQSLDGVRLLNQAQTRAVIVSHSPGDEVTLKVIRQGEPIVVKLLLGDYSNLETRANRLGGQGFAGQNRLDKPTLRQAWELRRERAQSRSGRAVQAAIDCGLTERQWDQIDIASGHREDEVSDARRMAAVRCVQQFQGGGRIMIRQGGQAVIRNFPQQEESPEAEATDTLAVAAGGSDRLEVRSAPRGFALGSGYDSGSDARRQLEEALRIQDSLIANQEAMLKAAANMPVEAKVHLSNQLQQLRLERAQIKSKMDQKLGHVEP